MLGLFRIANRSLQLRNACSFSGLGALFHKQHPLSQDLAKYDLVIVGANLGCALARHLHAVLVYQKTVQILTNTRLAYEKGKINKFKHLVNTRTFLTKQIAAIEGGCLENVAGDKNEITLKNGRKIKYDNLVIAIGQVPAWDKIKGFDEAWLDDYHPLYTSQDHPLSKMSNVKQRRTFTNFEGGQSIFYIPPRPSNELESYNFVLAKKIHDVKEKAGYFSWANSRELVINSGNTFSKWLPKVDSYLREKCKQFKIDIQEGLQLTEIKKDQMIAVFKDVKTGKIVQHKYGRLYTMFPNTVHDCLVRSGLTDANGELDVNPNTLKTKKFDNIYGLGDVTNVPTTKTFWGGFRQVAVLRHNLARKSQGLSQDAVYNGYAKCYIPFGQCLNYTVEHYMNGQNLNFNTNPIMGFINEYMDNKGNQKEILSKETWGPPYYKFKLNFNTPDVQKKPKQAAKETTAQTKHA